MIVGAGRGRRREMAGKTSKKQMILDCSAERRLERAGLAELRLIRNSVHDRIGSGPAPSLSYIANVLRRAGTPVDYEDRYTDPEIPQAYASRLEGALHFNDLASAEDALRRLDAAYHDYQAASDFAGQRLVRKLVLRGKQRAESLAANSRVSEEKRLQKREIANWFRVWLESPGLFFEWLAVRHQAEEFQRMFAAHPATTAAEPSPERGQS